MVDNVNKRVNYFDGQFLKVEDFQDEQAYHIDRERRPFKALISPGVCEGLEVSISEADSNRVTVSAGMAIDGEGRQIIVVSQDETFEIPEEAEATWSVCVTYHEEETEPANDGQGSSGNRRIHEAYSITIGETAPEASVQLATLTGDPGSWDIADARVYAGWQLPNGNGGGGTLRYQPENDKAEFIGNLDINGNLNLEGEGDTKITLNKDSIEFHDENHNTPLIKLRIEGDIVYGSGITGHNSDIIFHQSEYGYQWQDTSSEVRMELLSAESGGLTVSGTGESSFAGSLTVAGTVAAGKFEGEGAFVPGMIVMWSGLASDIDELNGWKLCDGNSGEPVNGIKIPDLTERFIVGCVDGSNLDEDGNCGEPTHHEHNFQVQSKNNVDTTEEMAYPYHSRTTEGYPWGVDDNSYPMSRLDYPENNLWPFNFPQALTKSGIEELEGELSETKHSHKITLSWSQQQTSQQEEEIRPKWYALCFIIKV